MLNLWKYTVFASAKYRRTEISENTPFLRLQNIEEQKSLKIHRFCVCKMSKKLQIVVSTIFGSLNINSRTVFVVNVVDNPELMSDLAYLSKGSSSLNGFALGFRSTRHERFKRIFFPLKGSPSFRRYILKLHTLRHISSLRSEYTRRDTHAWRNDPPPPLRGDRLAFHPKRYEKKRYQNFLASTCIQHPVYTAVVLHLFEVRKHFWLYEKFSEHQN